MRDEANPHESSGRGGDVAAPISDPSGSGHTRASAHTDSSVVPAGGAGHAIRDQGWYGAILIHFNPEVSRKRANDLLGALCFNLKRQREVPVLSASFQGPQLVERSCSLCGEPRSQCQCRMRHRWDD